MPRALRNVTFTTAFPSGYTSASVDLQGVESTQISIRKRTTEEAAWNNLMWPDLSRRVDCLLVRSAQTKLCSLCLRQNNAVLGGNQTLYTQIDDFRHIQSGIQATDTRKWGKVRTLIYVHCPQRMTVYCSFFDFHVIIKQMEGMVACIKLAWVLTQYEVGKTIIEHKNGFFSYSLSGWKRSTFED